MFIHVINVIENSYENHFSWVPKVLIMHLNGFCAGTFIFYGTSIFRSLPKEFSCYLLEKKSINIHESNHKSVLYFPEQVHFLAVFGLFSVIVDVLKSFLFWTQNADWGSLMFFFTSVNETADDQFVVHTTLEVCIHKSTLMWFSYSCINNIIGTKHNLQSEFSYKGPDISCTGIVADVLKSLDC